MGQKPSTQPFSSIIFIFRFAVIVKSQALPHKGQLQGRSVTSQLKLQKPWLLTSERL
tara:strand:+ start:245 stop:415 length:171 start_codon:yes stop_codon:yes gene_type:complete